MLSPRYPAAVIAGNVETSQAVTNALLLALGVQAAAQGTMNNTTWGDARRQYYETVCGGAGAGRLNDGRGHPGCSAVHTHMTNSRLTDPEVLEWCYPVLLEEFAIRRGSGGAGRWRGGDGVRRRIRFLEPMALSILSGHRSTPPPGLEGGSPGGLGRSAVIRAGGAEEILRPADRVEMAPGDVWLLETPGGGGFGSTSTRSSATGWIRLGLFARLLRGEKPGSFSFHGKQMAGRSSGRRRAGRGRRPRSGGG